MSKEAGRISVLGAGSWGTALAILAAKNGLSTRLWGHNEQAISEMAVKRENSAYLPGILFPEKLTVTANLEQAVYLSEIILISVPSHAFRNTVIKLKPFTSPSALIAWATKGFDTNSGQLLDQVVGEILGKSTSTAILSGPTFAKEVAAGLPTAVTIASRASETAEKLAAAMHNPYFRTYTSTDIVGVQIGGAAKNVMAIAAGISDGLGYGANTRTALITRGLAEMIRLGLALGGKQETLMGLAGLGDLVLTCTDNQSRNRRFGYALGRGQNQQQAAAEIAQEIEGVAAARETYLLSQQFNIEMPITENTYHVLYDDLPPAQAVANLLEREMKKEEN